MSTQKKILLFSILISFFNLWPTLTWAQVSNTVFSSYDDHITTYGFQRHIWQTSDGTLGAIVQLGADGLVLIRSVDNGMSWDKVLQIDQRDSVSASGEIDALGNIRAVVGPISYDSATDGSIIFILLNYNPQSRSWSKTKGSIIFVGDRSNTGSAPNITIDSMGTIWVCFRRTVSAASSLSVTVPVVYSLDDGDSWSYNKRLGTLNSVVQKFGILFNLNSRTGIIYFDHDETSYTLNWAYRNDSDPLNSPWRTKMIERISVSPGSNAYHTNVAKDNLGNLHLVYPNFNARWYRKFDGLWRAPEYLWDTESYQTVGVSGGDVYAVASIEFDLANPLLQRQIQYKKYNHNTGIWEGPFLLNETSYRAFDQVLVYDSENNIISDVTTPASDSNPGDIYGSNSGGMLLNSGDYIQFGMSEKFDHIGWEFLSRGNGGKISCKYWDGSSWRPLSVYKNVAGNEGWLDFVPPADWTKKSEDDITHFYYIRVEVIKPFQTGFVGSIITAMARFIRPVVPMAFKDLLPVLYVRGEISPYKLYFSKVPIN